MGTSKAHNQSFENPATRLGQVAPSDTTALGFVTPVITVEASGHLQAVTASGDTDRIFVAADIPFPLRVTQILATGMIATGIVRLS